MARIATPAPVCVDFETAAIRGRPAYPPEPVGVSIMWSGQPPEYFAWGHTADAEVYAREIRRARRGLAPSGLFASRGEKEPVTPAEIEAFRETKKQIAMAALHRAWSNPDGVLFHNAKFDLAVAYEKLGMPELPWECIHDTTLLLFLADPQRRVVALKPVAAEMLGLKAEEQDAVEQWLFNNDVRTPEGKRLSRAKGNPDYWAAYIAHAPSSIVGPYANGDTRRTVRLYREKLYPVVAKKGMLAAYDRERELLPILLANEKQGVRVDSDRLGCDLTKYTAVMAQLDAWIHAKLGDPDVNLDSNPQLVAAMVKAGFADVTRMGVTPKGHIKADKAAVEAGVADKVLAAVLRYRGALNTCLNTFMRPWYSTSLKTGGLIHTNWNQIKGERGGARTGRLSSSPNFQNIPKEFDPLFRHLGRLMKVGGWSALPVSPIRHLPPLPLCRAYIIPFERGDVIIGRDYSQQEPRILAHFGDGDLLKQYQLDPWIDSHDNAKAHLERVYHRTFDRKKVKTINLGIIYGQGVASLALKNHESIEETRDLRKAIYGLYPEVPEIVADMKLRAAMGEPLRTWGGRLYLCEEPAIVEYRDRETGEMTSKFQVYDYKMLNTLVQGSAADCTKQAMINFHRMNKNPRIRLLLQVHDELVASCPAAMIVEAQELLRDAMESVKFDVAMKSEGAYSNNNWGSMQDYDKKGVLLWQAAA